MLKKPIVAICYDFDGTLAPGNMQDRDYIPNLGMDTDEFWNLVKKRAKEQNADEILVYMNLMIEKATPENGVSSLRSAFKKFGKRLHFFPGVESWFNRINRYADSKGVKIEHYITSSGIKEMIEGTKIHKWFEKIFASSYIYDSNEAASWPAVAANFTAKTQFLFRIVKGTLDIWDNSKINEHTPDKRIRIPFNRMIYIGDGLTDVPCMTLVKEKGGYSIAVYSSHSRGLKFKSDKLRIKGRVNFSALADYRRGRSLDIQIKKVIDKMYADYKLGV